MTVTNDELDHRLTVVERALTRGQRIDLGEYDDEAKAAAADQAVQADEEAPALTYADGSTHTVAEHQAEVERVSALAAEEQAAAAPEAPAGSAVEQLPPAEQPAVLDVLENVAAATGAANDPGQESPSAEQLAKLTVDVDAALQAYPSDPDLLDAKAQLDALNAG